MADELGLHGIVARISTVPSDVNQRSGDQTIRISVREEDLDRAKLLVAEHRKRPRKFDWSKIDTGDGSPLTKRELGGVALACASCGYDLAGLDFELVEHCPECGVALVERRPIETYRVRSGRSDGLDRLTTWLGLAVLGALLAPVVLLLGVKVVRFFTLHR